MAGSSQRRNKDKERSKVGGKRKTYEGYIDLQWDSEFGDEYELLSVEGSDDDGTKHPIYKEGHSMNNFELVVEMKLKNSHEVREVLRDYIVREGYELTLRKNGPYMVTTVCKKGCDWRIHAYLVMGGPTFQIKTIKGEHICAKSNTNKFANYKYFGKKIEKIVRDNPYININQLKIFIMRKCEVDVSN